MSTDRDREARRAEVARRAANGESEREIARALGVSRTTVWTDKQHIDAWTDPQVIAASDERTER